MQEQRTNARTRYVRFVILQTCLLKQYGNSTIFTGRMYSAHDIIIRVIFNYIPQCTPANERLRHKRAHTWNAPIARPTDDRESRITPGVGQVSEKRSLPPLHLALSLSYKLPETHARQSQSSERHFPRRTNFASVALIN